MTRPLPSMSLNGNQVLHDLLTDTQSKELPAIWLGLTNAQQELYFECQGSRVLGGEETVTPDTWLQAFSATKLVTTIAALQIVEQGFIGLDDADQLYTVCPEFQTTQVLEKYSGTVPVFQDVGTRITLRMLLNHTAGFTYPINSPHIARYLTENGIPDVFSANAPLEAYIQPLAHQPGRRFSYGISTDWAGIMVTRLTGMNLEEYFQRYIWSKCGVTGLSFMPGDWAKRGMAMVTREQGKLSLYKGDPLGRPITPGTIGPLYSGGAGLFGSARDYLAFLRIILRSGDPSTPPAHRLISTENFKLLYEDSLPNHPDPRKDILDVVKEQKDHDPAMLHDENVGFSLGLLINKRDSTFGRRAMSGAWTGAARTFFWLDPESGIAGVCWTNTLTLEYEPFDNVYNRYERAVYDNLV